MESSSLSVHYHVQTTKNRLCKYTSLDIYILLSKTLKLYQILWKLGNHYFQQLENSSEFLHTTPSNLIVLST